MTGFIVAAAVLLLVTLALLLRPWWWKNGANAAQSQRRLNITIHRDQLEELGRDRAAGTLSADDYETARQEIQRRLIEDTALSDGMGTAIGAKVGVGDMKSPEGVTPVAPSARLTFILLALALPLAGTGLYAWLGTPAALNPPAPEHKITAEEVDKMVASLAARLEKEPENKQGWVMLARSYKVLGRFDAAAKAYARAGSFIDKEPDLLADYADVMIAARRAFTPESRKLLERALMIDPKHAHALWLSGTDAFDAGKYDRAIALWERVAAQFPPDSEEVQQISGSIAEARAKGGKSSGKAVAKTGAAAGSSVSGTVDLAPALKEKVGAGDTLMVVARVAGGPRIPVAVLRASAAALPLQFTLDDSLAMSPDMRISKAESVEVEARISKSGQALPQKDDLYSAAQTVKLGAGGVKLLIDQIRP